MVFQDYALYPHKTVFENMAFGLRLRKLPEHEIQTPRRRRGRASCRSQHLLERKPRELSGGQRQRVAMGRAIVRQPKAFLFDEPLSNLDALLRAEMRVEIKKLHQRLGNTIIYVTHDQVEAMTLADRIVVLQEGNLIQYDTPDGIYNRPAAKFVAGFTGSPPMNFAPCRIGEGGRVLHLEGRRRPAGAGALRRRVRAPLRPRGDASACGPSTSASPRRDAPGVERIDGKVLLVEPLGAETLGLIKLGASDDAAEMTGRFAPDAHLRVGQNLTDRARRSITSTCSTARPALAIRGAGW